MPEQFQQPNQLPRRRLSQALAEVQSRRPACEDELALGCECADPALQIEHWAQELPLLQGGA